MAHSVPRFERNSPTSIHEQLCVCVCAHGFKTWRVKFAFFYLTSYHQISTLKVTGCCVCMLLEKFNSSCLSAGMHACWKQ